MLQNIIAFNHYNNTDIRMSNTVRELSIRAVFCLNNTTSFGLLLRGSVSLDLNNPHQI